VENSAASSPAAGRTAGGIWLDKVVKCITFILMREEVTQMHQAFKMSAFGLIIAHSFYQGG